MRSNNVFIKKIVSKYASEWCANSFNCLFEMSLMMAVIQCIPNYKINLKFV